jgi:hypothetical protein
LQQLHLPPRPASRRKVVKAPRSGKAENVFNSLNARLDLLELEEATLRRYVNKTTIMYNKALASLLKDATRRTNSMRADTSAAMSQQRIETLDSVRAVEEDLRVRMSTEKEKDRSIIDEVKMEMKSMEEKMWFMERIVLVLCVIVFGLCLRQISKGDGHHKLVMDEVTPPVSPENKNLRFEVEDIVSKKQLSTTALKKRGRSRGRQ